MVLTNRNNCLNILKCIACFGVVFIHVPFPGVFGVIIKYMSTFAVPLFFMIAGYYSYGCTEAKIFRRLIKIVKILIFAILCFLIWEIINQLKNHTLISWFIINFNWKMPIKFFVFCTIPWSIHLWYLIAMSETYLTWFIIVKHRLEHKAIRFCGCFLLLGAILDVIVESFGFKWLFKVNFLLRALPWFMLGYMIHKKYKSNIPEIKNSKLALIASIGWIITISVVFFNIKINYNYIGVLITAPSLFILAIKNSNIKISKPIEYIAEKLSLFIYIFHPLVSSIIIIFMKNIININGIYTYFHPVITLFASIFVSLIFDLLLSKKI